MTDWNEQRARRLLPPIGALQSFAAAARSGSFSRAAAEVGLGQSAVSRQVGLLEDWLGTGLFERRGRRVALTDAGRAYAEAIAPALARIRQATARAMAGEARALRVATLPSFGMRWLAPRLPALTRAHPEVVIDFTARADEFDLASEGFDAAIHYGAPLWPGAALDLLFYERSVAVASPLLLAGRPVREPADLLALPLLVQSARRDAWTAWLRAAGGQGEAPAPAIAFDQFQMLAQAAASGAGAALLPRFLIEPELEAGALVAPLGTSLAGSGAYYLAYEPHRLAEPNLRAFRDWLLAEAAASV